MSAYHRLAALTTQQARGAQAQAHVAILPVGAIEQHGPHLSVATDARIAEEFAARLADALGRDALLCPLVPYGLSEHHEAFAGTVTLSPPAFISLMLDLVASLHRQGLPRVIIVNGHGGNIDALNLVVRRARTEVGVPVASVMWARLARDVCAEAAAGDAYGHACELETSVAMVLAPDCVRPERIRAPEPRPAAEPLSAPPAAYVDVAASFDELTTDGVYGDPTQASRELGERIVAVALERATAFATRFMQKGAT
jgi:creatinine amidohydrolase